MFSVRTFTSTQWQAIGLTPAVPRQGFISTPLQNPQQPRPHPPATIVSLAPAHHPFRSHLPVAPLPVRVVLSTYDYALEERTLNLLGQKMKAAQLFYGDKVAAKCVLWVEARSDYEPLFSILDGLRHDADRRFWIESFVTPEENCDIEADTGQVSTGVKIVLQMSHNPLTVLPPERLSPAVSATYIPRNAVACDAAALGDLITCGEGGPPLRSA